MKKIFAAVLAAAMALSMAATAFASNAKVTVTKPDNGTIDAAADYYSLDKQLTAYPNRSTIDVTKDYLYTKKSGDLVFKFQMGDKERLRADVTDGKISVSVKRESNNIYKVTIKPKYGVRDFDLKDWKVELDAGDTKIYYIKGKGAYSDTQSVFSGDRLTVRDSKLGADDGSTGAIFDFSEVLTDETRIRCNDYVDIYFKGNYGTDKENLAVSTDKITEVANFFGDTDIDCYDFIGVPKFATKVKVIIDADPNSVIYQYNKKTGDLTRVDATYDSDGWSFTAKSLGTYVLAEEEYDTGNVKG